MKTPEKCCGCVEGLFGCRECKEVKNYKGRPVRSVADSPGENASKEDADTATRSLNFLFTKEPE